MPNGMRTHTTLDSENKTLEELASDAGADCWLLLRCYPAFTKGRGWGGGGVEGRGRFDS